MRAHTPGPWNRGIAQHVYQGARWDPANQQRLVATAECPSTRTQKDWEETWANAALIAAAPDLLAALECFVGEYHADSNRFECAELFTAARAAIANARGEPL